MLTTEDEAKKRWCPESRTMLTILSQNAILGEQPEAIASCNRNVKGKPLGSCIGSACMAWRWATNGMLLDGNKPPEGNVYGYCGKAGRP